MSNWSNNNRACTSTWTTLFRMGQIRANFSDSGKLPIGQLTFYSNLSSAELRRQEASIIADQMDNIFRFGRGAVYEESFDRTKSLSQMVEILVTEDMTVTDLARTIDDCYLFWQENSNEIV